MEIREGLRWVYRHPVLAPMAVGSHGWFLFNSILGTVYVVFALSGFGLSAVELGLTLAAAGVAALLGSSLSTRFGRRWGAGRAVIASNLVMTVGWVVIALAPGESRVLCVVVLAIGQGLYGFGLGLSNANEMGYRQAITPDHLQGRMNTTIRSANRAMIVLGAPLGGVLAVAIGYRPTLWIAIGGFLVVAAFLSASPFRSARHGDEPQ
jgi:MFS family permease